MTSSPEQQQAPMRAIAEYENVGKKKGMFDVQKHSYAQQYSQLYFVRLASLLPHLQTQSRLKWASGKIAFAERIIDVQADALSCIIGTVYVEMEHKPNVLKELASDLNIVKAEIRERYTGGRTKYWLEDDSARIALQFAPNLQPGNLMVTGVSVSLLGRENEKGVFVVEDVCFAGIEDAMVRNQQVNPPSTQVALVSGVSFSPLTTVSFDFLSAYLCGDLPCPIETAQSISRVVFAGNTIAEPARIDEPAAKKKYGVEHSRYDFAPLKLLDSRLARLSTSIPVDIMPGEAEPAGLTLPQAALHPGMFPESSRNSGFQPVSNPYVFELDGHRFLGTAGQNLDDVMRYSEIEDRLEAAERMLHWRNIVPTAPDTLWSFPFFDRDPFILNQIPDVFFVGNQPVFQSKTIQRENGRPILIILLPKFSDSSSIVLVNTVSLTCEQVILKTLI